MKERPILFSGPMVRALLREVDPKTMTRRVMKPQPVECIGGIFFNWSKSTEGSLYREDFVKYCPYGQPGDRLYCKESYSTHPTHYKADGYELQEGEGTWHNAMFMARKYSRILLEITAVRVERVQEITAGDAIAEGIEQIMCEPDEETNKALRRIGAKEVTEPYPIGWKNYLYKEDKRYKWHDPNPDPEYYPGWPWHSFRSLWDSINAKRGYSWESNPWNWVVEFKRITSRE
ncbi:hypothetical protein LCGC14_1517380 [marine sediment metagenome]|uniref:Uncharacterized protein n=1 Tax=marine sediment metagenome TaxID=412755 RepID=A0A0F9IZW5_9ZZZZ